MKRSVERKMDICDIHGETMFNKHLNGYKGGFRFKCSKCASEATARVVKEKQDRAYERYGHSCKNCGYSKCRTALEFHHIDPKEKEITPSKVFSRKWESIIKELDKCILLCANCHREVHSGVLDISHLIK